MLSDVELPLDVRLAEEARGKGTEFGSERRGFVDVEGGLGEVVGVVFGSSSIRTMMLTLVGFVKVGEGRKRALQRSVQPERLWSASNKCFFLKSRNLRNGECPLMVAEIISQHADGKYRSICPAMPRPPT